MKGIHIQMGNSTMIRFIGCIRIRIHKSYLTLAPSPSHILVGDSAKAIVLVPIQAPEIYQWGVKRCASGSLGKECRFLVSWQEKDGETERK